MAYVDDVNCLLPLEDIEFFLEKFNEYGRKYGAIMNSEKTRILTSTSGDSIIKLLQHDDKPESSLMEESLRRAITKYSRRKNQDGSTTTHGEVDGLQILGIPIGSPSFCTKFLTTQLDKARLDAAKILKGLDNEQTMLQLYRQCTVHKMTHLFASDVVSRDITVVNYPNKWDLWHSPMGQNFDNMTDNFLSALSRCKKMPIGAMIISSMGSTVGGLGLKNPRCMAIPSFIFSIKRSLLLYKKWHMDWTQL